METIHIASASDERYFPGLLATFSSILINGNRNYKYSFHLIDGGLSTDSKNLLIKTLKMLNPDVEAEYLEQDLSMFDDLPKMFFGSALPYARLLLPELLKIDRVVYVDSDILFMKDVAELWNLDLKGKYAAASLDTAILTIGKEFPEYQKFNLKPAAPFFNSGVMLLDLSAFRKYQLHKEVLRLRATFADYFTFHDQSPLNVVLFGKFFLLGQEWNYQIREMNIVKDHEKILQEPLNFHFSTSFKPWLGYNYNVCSFLFYVLIEELGYHLNDPAFIHSKSTFERKLKLGGFLPYCYNIRSILKKLRGDIDAARVDERTAVHWKKKNKENKFLRSREKEIQNLTAAWGSKIENAWSVSKPEKAI